VIKKILYGAALLAVLSSAANAATFDFSYTFSDGEALTGTLVGTLSGDQVTDISNVTVDFNGTAYTGTLSAGAFNSATNSWDYSANAAVISTDATKNNFIIADSTDSQGVGITNYFYYVNDLASIYADNLNSGDQDLDSPGAGKWSLIPTPIPAALPLLLSGLGLFQVARRRQGGSHAR